MENWLQPAQTGKNFCPFYQQSVSCKESQGEMILDTLLWGAMKILLIVHYSQQWQ